ncbi:MAG: hypothetical protein IT323_08655 [Anaerolineae bacterium]|nr:hypothetical protein [Anaerolineae bacterium]
MSAPHDAALHDAPELLDHGVMLEWLENGQVAAFQPSKNTPEALATVFDRAEAIVRGWPSGKPHLVLLDLKTADISPTPYIRRRGEAIQALRPDVLIATAILTQRNVAGQFLRVVVAKTQKEKGLVAVHFSRDDAITWLKRVGGIG